MYACPRLHTNTVVHSNYKLCNTSHSRVMMGHSQGVKLKKKKCCYLFSPSFLRYVCPCFLQPGEDSPELAEIKRINREYQVSKLDR